MIKKSILCWFSINIILLLVSCEAVKHEPGPVIENPQDVKIDPVEESNTYITIYVNEVMYNPVSNGEKDRFRLYVIVSDDQGHMGGMLCPGYYPMTIHPGESIEPCDTAISILEDYPDKELYVMLLAVNEEKSSEVSDVWASFITASLAEGLVKAIEVIGSVSITGPAVVGLIALDAVIGYAGGEVVDWMNQQEVLGVQYFLLTRNEDWLAGKKIIASSENKEMKFSFTTEITSTLPEYPIPNGIPELPITEKSDESKEIEPKETFFDDDKKREPQGTIVFQCTIDGYQQVCIMNADGTGQKQFTHIDYAAATYPSISSDGKSVIYTSNQTGDHAIYEMDRNTLEVKQITESGGDKAYPMVSPDGNLITYTDINNAGGNSIYIMNRNGSSLQEISTGTRAEFSHDGQKLSFICGNWVNPDICIMNTDGSILNKITDISNLNYRVSWSPDGNWLTFSTGKKEDKNRKIYIIRADGSELKMIYGDGNAVSPQFSPDGEWIVFSNYKIDGKEVLGEIFIIRADGTDLRRLTNNDRTDWLPFWGK